jgi:hypothetical protein
MEWFDFRNRNNVSDSHLGGVAFEFDRGGIILSYVMVVRTPQANV